MEHWDERYRTTSPAGRSWTEDVPADSLAFIEPLGLAPDDPVIDVGGGASRLVDALCARGFRDLTVLDLSGAALDEARRRVAAAHPEAAVEWVVADVTAWEPTRTYRLWHDRAVFHFLTGRLERRAYVDRLERATSVGSHVVMATFAPDGPETCSGLAVTRWSAARLAAELGDRFELVAEARRLHTTPWMSTQPFTWAVLRRRA